MSGMEMGKIRTFVSVVMAVLAITLVVTLPAYSQEFLPFSFGFAGPQNQSMDFNSFLQGTWLRSLTLGKVSAGIFWGDGSLNVAHTIEAGPNFVAAIPGFHDFDDFSHQRETPLTDTFFELDGSLIAQGFEFLKVKFQTNVGRVTQFKQFTEPGVQRPFGHHSRYAVGSVIRLPNNLEGIIFMDNRNKIWTWELTGRIPGYAGFDILLEYKWGSVRSCLDPYSTSNPILGSQFLAPNIGWRNNWTSPALPSTTSFNMTQNFTWHGPFIGVSWRNPFLAWGGRGYIDFVGSPAMFGKYEFDWGAAYEDAFFFVKGFQGTQIVGWDRVGLELRGGIEFSLVGNVTLDVAGKYTYIRLKGNDTEFQTMSNNFLATRFYIQGAQEYVTLTQRFWQVGGNINLAF